VWPGGFAEWDRSYRPAIRESITARLHVVANLLLLFLCFSVGLAGSGPEGAVLAGYRFRSFVPTALSVASWVALAALLAGNALFHITGTIQTRRYSPGLATGVSLYIPLAAVGIWYFVHTGEISRLAAAWWIVVGASYQVWATIFHRIRTQHRPTQAGS
jgi:hypothetical protein